MIDTHCHLYFEEFVNDFDEVLVRSNTCLVKEFWLPSVCSLYHSRMLDLKKKYMNLIKLMVGIHPSYVKKNTIDFELKKIKSFLKYENCIAIGEIGIDLYKSNSNIEIQKIAFIKQVRIAKKKKIPIIIHARKSIIEVLTILKNENFNLSKKGIFHCFSGDLPEAMKIIEFGFLLGISGIVTFTNGKIDKFLHQIPLKYIVLETDSPYLAPSPFRGKRNEPSFIINIVKKLSLIYKVSIEEIIEITTKNAKNLIF